MSLHDGQPVAPHDFWTAWSFEPAVVIGLVAAAWLYPRGVRALWRNAGWGHGVKKWEAAAFGLAWLLLTLALVSPLHGLGRALFSAHMAQHEILMTAATPLLVLGRPFVAFLWAVPPSWRRFARHLSNTPVVRRSWGVFTHPLAAWALHALAIWLWHLPSWYQATLESEGIHTLQHLSFILSALLFWWSLLRVRQDRLGRPTAVIYLFTTAVHTTLLGAFLTFSTRLWYPLYSESTAPWGLTPLEDQQLAGLIMWIPGGVAYLLAALAVAGSWLKEPLRALPPERARISWLMLMVLVPLLSACKRGSEMSPGEAARVTGGDPRLGAVALREYGCAACHTIPGIPGARANVGPSLAGVSGRLYIAGVLTNSPANLTRWIMDPQQVDSLTAMPDVGLTQADARNIVAYLYTLD
jgi:putative membrane protein